MNPNEPTAQALLAGLRTQGAVDGELWLHALIDPDQDTEVRGGWGSWPSPQ